MKVKNITDSAKQIIDNSTGKLIIIEAGKTAEIGRAYLKSNTFIEVIKQTEQKEKKITEKEVI